MSSHSSIVAVSADPPRWDQFRSGGGEAAESAGHGRSVARADRPLAACGSHGP